MKHDARISRPRFRSLAAAACLAVGAGGVALLAPHFVNAQGNAPAAVPAPAPAAAPAPDTVVATVNGEQITEGDLAIAMDDFSEQLQQVPPAQQRKAVLDALIDLKLIANAAKKEGLDQGADLKRRLALLQEQALRSEYIRTKIGDGITDEEVKKRYDLEIGGVTPPEEVHARHILVPTEDEAKAIIQQLKNGGDFAAIAKEKSKDPGSAANGGDLGFFSKGQMVPEFDQAAFALQPGQFTETPVKSEFGYHIIKVEEKRKQPLPPFDAVKDQIRQIVMADAYQDKMKALRDAATINVVGAAPSGPAAPNAGPGAAPAPATPAPR